jgi:hypothetical protein
MRRKVLRIAGAPFNAKFKMQNAKVLPWSLFDVNYGDGGNCGSGIPVQERMW